MRNDYSLWKFDQVAIQDPERASRLLKAPSWEDLMLMIRRALCESLLNGEARFGFEESGRNNNDQRVVVQFPIGEQLFDWFFNAHTGYRGQFRVGVRNGLVKNNRLVTILRNELEGSTQETIVAKRLSPSSEDLGAMNATVQDVLGSIDPVLSKLWLCERLIGPVSDVRNLNVFRTGPQLQFDTGCAPWCSLEVADGNAWIELKGAFAGKQGLYQPKDPAIRGQQLQERGSA